MVRLAVASGREVLRVTVGLGLGLLRDEVARLRVVAHQGVGAHQVRGRGGGRGSVRGRGRGRGRVTRE